MTTVVKVLFVEIWTRYVAASPRVAQLNVGTVETPKALSAGLNNTGEEGMATMVVKLQAKDHGPVPFVFFALTRQ
jgi:hypothetical protein